ncbi:MAG: TldD/PmbA family protein [Bdellovibrionales bacterium]
MIGSKELNFFQNQFDDLSQKNKVEFDFYAYENKSHCISFEKQKLKNYSSSEDKNLALRVSNEDQSGVSYTKDFSKESLKTCFQQALNSLKISDKKERGETSFNQEYKNMESELYDPKLSSVKLAEKLEKVKSMDQSSLSVDDRIQPAFNVAQDQESSLIFGNNKQAQGRYKTNEVFAYSYSLAIDKNHRSQGITQKNSRNYTKIDFKKLGEDSARKSLKKLRFSIPQTKRYSVVFEAGQASSTLVSILLSHLNGKNIYDNLSLLKNSLNQKKLSSLVSLYDDPFAIWGASSAPFDGEGFASQKTDLVKQGVIQNYLTNSFVSKKLKVPHTSKAFRSDNGLVTVGSTNAVMEEGQDSFSSLVQNDSKVIVIDMLKGMAGYNAISGDFSIESEGFLWDRGESQAICQFTVSGNLIDVFARISKVANDSLVYNGSYKIPSFFVPELSIAGS